MTETVLLAIIAVAGTALGASVSPLLNAITSARSSRSDDQSNRIRAVAEFAIALRHFAGKQPDSWDPSVIRVAYEAAVEKRFEVARAIPRGAGNVDWFCEYSLDRVQKLSTMTERVAAADFACSELLSWARGDRLPKDLERFRLQPDGMGGYDIV